MENYKSFFIKKIIQALAAAITGSTIAFVFGSALILIYFLNIGGIPIGQSINFTNLSNVVFPISIFIISSIILIWILPIIITTIPISRHFAEQVYEIFLSTKNKAKSHGNNQITFIKNVSDIYELSIRKIFMHISSTIGIASLIFVVYITKYEHINEFKFLIYIFLFLISLLFIYLLLKSTEKDRKQSF